MARLEPDDVLALAKAAGVDLHEPFLTEVAHNLNALLDGLAAVDPRLLDVVEPTPVVATTG